MANKYKLTARLRQYTPLIHFQGDTEGACLRPSEVKPKLDRFVQDYLKRQGVKVPEAWKLKVSDDEKENRNPALRYKMRIEGTPEKTQAHELYFAANIGGEGTAAEYKQPVIMTILSLVSARLGCTLRLYQGELDNPTLLEVLDALIPAFFALHCFGTRSGKGFGSFEVISNRNLSDSELDYYKEHDCLKLIHISSKARFYKPQQCLDDIFILSGMMKGGFNRPYFKGEIQKALWHKNLGSDKAFVKQNIFPFETVDDKGTTLLDWYQVEVCHNNNRSKEKKSDYRYIRAMLGLADHYDYGVGRDTKKTIEVAADNEEIVRFANPVRFKPCQGGFRVLVYEVPDAMWNAKFWFSFNKNPYELCTPAKGEFDLVRFVDDFLSPLYDSNARKVHGWRFLDKKTYTFFPTKRTIQFDETLQMLRVDYGRGSTR